MRRFLALLFCRLHGWRLVDVRPTDLLVIEAQLGIVPRDEVLRLADTFHSHGINAVIVWTRHIPGLCFHAQIGTRAAGNTNA